jgi:hypothetical protein
MVKTFSISNSETGVIHEPTVASTVGFITISILVAMFGVIQGQLFWNAAPLIVALLSGRRRFHVIGVAAYVFSIATALSLALLETNGEATIGHYLGLWILCIALVYLTYKIGVAAALLCLLWIPIWPGHPMLLLGYATPMGAGAAIIVAFCMVLALDRTPAAKLPRILLLLATISGLGQSLWLRHDTTARSIPLFNETTLATETPGYQSAARHIVSQVPPGSTIITGENILRPGTRTAGVSYWCRAARKKNLTIYLGIEDQLGAGQMWRVSSEDCPNIALVYDPYFGVPGFSQGEGFGTILPTDFSGKRVTWMACFEAMSLRRWLSPDVRSGELVVTYANDNWIKTFPARAYRRSTASLAARLFGKEIYFADKNRSALVLLRKEDQ